MGSANGLAWVVAVVMLIRCSATEKKSNCSSNPKRLLAPDEKECPQRVDPGIFFSSRKVRSVKVGGRILLSAVPKARCTYYILASTTLSRPATSD